MTTLPIGKGHRPTPELLELRRRLRHSSAHLMADAVVELFPEAKLWPADRAQRARARAVSAEMHAGFAALRRDMSMDLGATRTGQGHTPEALADAHRVQAIWREALGHCLKKDGSACHVVAGGKRCVATASNDSAPAAVALGASIALVSGRSAIRSCTHFSSVMFLASISEPANENSVAQWLSLRLRQ